MQFPYTPANNTSASLMPRLPMILTIGKQHIEVFGLIDSGSAINVLPYSVGAALGASWDEQVILDPLAGNLGHYEARALVAYTSHPQLTSNALIRLVFAWTLSEDAPVIFGQMNFFMEFDVCFYRSQSMFDVNLKSH